MFKNYQTNQDCLKKLRNFAYNFVWGREKFAKIMSKETIIV